MMARLGPLPLLPPQLLPPLLPPMAAGHKDACTQHFWAG
jgi:hypothetical protein